MTNAEVLAQTVQACDVRASAFFRAAPRMGDGYKDCSGEPSLRKKEVS